MLSSILNRLVARKKGALPGYSSLRSVPLCDVAPDLVEDEHSASYATSLNAIQCALQEPPRRPSEDAPLFTSLAAPKKSGFVTMTLPDGGGQCVPVFTAPIRAADYTETCLAQIPGVQYLVSSPVELVRLLSDLRSAGTEFLALDRCPRCSTFMTVEIGSLKTPGDILTLWSVVKSTELARFDLYMRHALKSAHAGLFELARQVAFETVVHVGPDDPRPHLLLGQLAAVSGDRKTLAEAKSYLRLMGFDAWERKLDQDAQSGSLDFGQPEFFAKLQS